MAVNYTDVQKTEKYISRTNFDALEMAAVPEGTEFNIVDQIHESDLDSDILQKLNNNAKINTENTFTAAQTFKKDITIEGNIIQKGKAYETHAEKLYTKNDMIYTRDGATAALADNAYTGIQAVKYDGTNDGQLVFGKDGVARVGDIGKTQPLATRAEKDALIDGHILQWNAAGQTLVDSGRTLDEFAKVEGDNTFTGANTFTDSIVIQGEANTVGLNVSDPSNPTILTRVLRNQISVTDSSNGMKVSLCSAGKLTVQDNSTSAKYQPGKITYNKKDLLFPETEAGGTFALTKDLPEANPPAAGTVALTKLKIGDTVYNLPSGGGSGDVTAAGNNTFTGSNTFTKHFSVYDEVSGNRATLDYNALTLEGPIINETCRLSPAGLEHSQMDDDGATILHKAILAFENEEDPEDSTTTITVPNKTGTLALTSDLPVANPTAPGTSRLARLKIGSIVYSLPDIPDTSNFVTLSGAQTISGNKTFTGDSTFSGTNTFDNLGEIGGSSKPGTPGFGNCKLRVS